MHLKENVNRDFVFLVLELVFWSLRQVILANSYSGKYNYFTQTRRKALLQLYNALNHTDYQDEQALQIVTLDGVVYMAMNNDVAFLLVSTFRFM